MLTGTGQYSERNVRELGQNVRALLQEHTKEERQNAIGGEFEGYYLLLIGGKIYALDTQVSAFANYSYYSDEEKAQNALPWYVWDLPCTETYPFTYSGMVSNGNVLRLMTAREVEDGRVIEVHTAKIDRPDMYSGSGDERDVYPIPCSFATKLYDFGRPDTRKAVDELYIDVADIEDGRIRVDYMTERATEEEACIIDTYGDAAEREPGYVRTVRLTPNIHLTRQFGLRLSSEGSMSIERILIKTRQQGVVK